MRELRLIIVLIIVFQLIDDFSGFLQFWFWF